jgi:hypothetical protein
VSSITKLSPSPAARDRRGSRLPLVAVLALALAGCAQGGAVVDKGSGDAAAWPDPYHYHCTGSCLMGL